eukprot:PITA_14609
MVKKWWSEPLEVSGSKLFNPQKKLKTTKQKIKEWNKTVFGNIFQEKVILENKLEQIHKDGAVGNYSAEAMEQEKTLSQSAPDHRSNNRILELKNNAGEILKNHNDISALLSDHFKSIAQEPPINREEAIKELTVAIPKNITSDQNWALCREVSLEEEVWEVVEDSRRSRTILKSLNSTFLALIPKVEEAKTPDKFRPIALCNVIYKIISKVIANRLKTILPGIISEAQSGYVEDRQILDNILLAQEMIHSLHSRKEASMIMQLDLSKAYDKVSWKYLEVVLGAFGFCRTWIKWILALIKSPRYSILVNGAPSILFTPLRGIRQGDPLSPFLFVILMEGLSRTIARKKSEGTIKGLQPIRSLPATTHQ